MQTIVNLVSAGLGLALVPRSMMQMQRSGVVYRALPLALRDGAPLCETSLLWRVDAAPSVLRFVEFVQGFGAGRQRAGRKVAKAVKPGKALSYRSR